MTEPESDHSMDAERYGRGDCCKEITVANVNCQVRRAILERHGLQPEVLKGKWRSMYARATRQYQRQYCMAYEHAEAMAFEWVLCQMWLDGKQC